MNDFSLGNPVLVCRWRLSQRQLPLSGRHLRALAARSIDGKRLSPELVAWAKQHIEWTLDEGARNHPDGVLMLAVDNEGRAAMTVGAFHALAHTSSNDLLARAQGSWKEAQATGVSPEDLWLVRGDSLVWGSISGQMPAGASSLVLDLARTLGMPVKYDANLLDAAASEGMHADEVFLVSDEYGVVPASDRSGQRATKFESSYQKLLLTAGERRR